MPEKFNSMMDLSAYRKFTMKERLQILFGYRAVISVRIFARHSPGAITSDIQLRTTKEIIDQNANQK